MEVINFFCGVCCKKTIQFDNVGEYFIQALARLHTKYTQNYVTLDDIKDFIHTSKITGLDYSKKNAKKDLIVPLELQMHISIIFRTVQQTDLFELHP